MKPKLTKLSLLIIILLNGISISANENDRRFVMFDASDGLADNGAQTITCTKTGRMVISTIGHINFYDGSTFEHIDPEAEHIHPLPAYTGHYHLYFDKYHHLWLKDKSVITCVDLMTEEFVVNVDSVYKTMGMKGRVEDFFADHDCHIWYLSGNQLRSAEYGMDVTVRKGVELQDVDVIDSAQVMMFYADGIVKVYDLKSKKHLYDTKPDVTEDKAHDYGNSSVVKYHEGKIYQLRNGNSAAILLSYDVKTREWKTLLQHPYNLNNITIYDNHFYIPCRFGYWVAPVNGGTWEHVESVTMTNGRQLETDVNTIAFDRQGGMWLGTERRGVLYAMPYATPFTIYQKGQPEAAPYIQMLDDQVRPQVMLPRHVNCAFDDSRGWRWTGTYSGLRLQKGRGQQYQLYTNKDGLNNEMIHSIIEDDNHDIWVGTSCGIARLWIVGDSVRLIRNYDYHDNIPTESFLNGRVLKTSDGTIVMQSMDHIVTFNPEEFRYEEMENISLYPKLTKWIVGGREVVPGMTFNGHQMIDRTISRVAEMRANYDYRSMELVFSGLNFWRPIQTNYRLRIKGVYDNWQVFSFSDDNNFVHSDGMLHLPLNGLSPGTYRIELQVSMTPDKWDTRPFVWTLHIDQPWWRSTGIYLLLFGLMVILLIVNMVMYNRNMKLRMMLYNEEEDILRRLRNYVERCNALKEEVLTPYTMQVGNVTKENNSTNKEFVEVMTELVKYVNAHENGKYSLNDLAKFSGKDLERLYVLLSDNLYKSPRQMALRLRLKEAADLLRTTAMTQEEIAERCNFVSVNYFIASFYHQYRQTPKGYRKMKHQKN